MNKFIIIVTIILIIIEVASGKKRVNPSLLIKISPGSFPTHGNFGPKIIANPTIIITIPTKIIILAKSFILPCHAELVSPRLTRFQHLSLEETRSRNKFGMTTVFPPYFNLSDLLA